MASEADGDLAPNRAPPSRDTRIFPGAQLSYMRHPVMTGSALLTL